MRGFFRRDLYLTIHSLRLQLGLLALFVLASLVTRSASLLPVLNTYAYVFSVSGLAGLSQTDEKNGWLEYSLAIPGGRRAQVLARYLLTLLLLAAGAVLSGGTGLLLLGREGLAPSLTLWGGWALYAALALPLGYRFGSESRMALVLTLALAAGITATIWASLNPDTDLALWPVLSPLAGLIGLGISLAASLGIMAGKEGS